ncbi:competence type IV pilus major pilin ComGC [Metasolibacillus sp. FSL H7-0170]|uniref:competence type IV pilus major pilin ComGC n=1 Tax=Metasolibacillus sp. FSL H7-0170 TaxID=2921431 RepID=UPI0031581EFF
MKNEKGFTLVEMLVVLLIVSILILVTIPNVTKHFATIDSKGCSAYMTMLQGQVEAYKIDHMTTPTVTDLFNEEYIESEEAKCPNGELVTINGEGKVILVGNSEEG